jgi:LmbE family N-acetylglucosaminyl deacetylase
MPDAVRVLSFLAHPDDAEFVCAGTLARLKAEAGCQIAIATATSGDCGAIDKGPHDIARTRHAEAEAAAALLDAPYYAAGSIDLLIVYDEPTIRRFVEVVRKARPDIVLTHSPVDYMVDHEMTSRLVRTACFAAPAPNFLTYAVEPAPTIDRVPHLYYADPVECKDIFGRPVEPDFIVDISATMDLKERMLCCHASQREWLRSHHNMDHYVHTMREASAARGRAIGVAFGEGFRQHRGHSYPQDNRIASLLGI